MSRQGWDQADRVMCESSTSPLSCRLNTELGQPSFVAHPIVNPIQPDWSVPVRVKWTMLAHRWDDPQRITPDRELRIVCTSLFFSQSASNNPQAGQSAASYPQAGQSAASYPQTIQSAGPYQQSGKSAVTSLVSRTRASQPPAQVVRDISTGTTRTTHPGVFRSHKTVSVSTKTISINNALKPMNDPS